jgi:putative transposase
MRSQPNSRHRRSIRLREYDYTEVGAYFVTICAYNRECLFGEIVHGEMRLNGFGKTIEDEWLRTATIRPYIELGEVVIMPNHVHGIVSIRDEGRGKARLAPTTGTFGYPVGGSLPTIIGAFKSASTKRINEMRGTPGAPLWQRNYFEHVIRNEAELNRIREYIALNPSRWDNDLNNPERQYTIQYKSEFDEVFVGARRAVPSSHVTKRQL